VTFLGLTRADDMLMAKAGTSGGIDVYAPAFGSGFSILVEAKPGSSGAPVSNFTFREEGPPDLQIQVSSPLGDPTTAVCDDMPPLLGGVPAIDPPRFGDDQTITDTLNDLACRFLDGAGNKVGRRCSDQAACVLQSDGDFGCASEDATAQFCGFINQALVFPSGDTLVTVRVLDVSGRAGPPKQMIVRVP
jgi:hypothetical protein